MEKSHGAFFIWPEAFQAGVEAAGGKGWNLGRLERYGFRVPSGGVLAAVSYQSFIKENNLLEDTGKITQSVTISNIGEKETEQKLFQIREKIKAGRISSDVRDELESSLKKIGILGKPLAIRSSATAEDSAKASFAGVHESFLNVQGMDNILSAIKGCYASLWTLRAVAYRRKMDIKDDPAFEIIQKRTGRKEGKTMVRVTGGTEFVESTGTPAGQVLCDENIRQLGLLIQRVFDALGCGEQHQDIEWVFDGKDFALVQARPVTALPRYTFAGIKNQPDIWSNANFRDAAPMVQSTLNWSLLKYLMAGQKVNKHFTYINNF